MPEDEEDEELPPPPEPDIKNFNIPSGKAMRESDSSIHPDREDDDNNDDNDDNDDD